MDELNAHLDLNYTKYLLDNNLLICECNCVSVAEIKSLFKQRSEIDLEILKQKFGFGSGCQSCVKNKDTWIDNIF
ncbi:MAG: (2Fe-2S)-binding protein [Bacteriovoracaceae bacterium]|nr:(2Fe-2S)-binding protein [Bacteriovoracaceae bacterium]